MAMAKIGERVGAILRADETTVYLYGFGIYEGNFVPEEAVGWLADAAREMQVENPRLRLDSGEVVYGCECWWSNEEHTRRMMGDRAVVEVSITAIRKAYREGGTTG